ncbi:MAG: ORF6N domain-containing protein [Prevotella sp.]|nr:ORF6N domain-containing protein [Prevotella sp.]
MNEIDKIQSKIYEIRGQRVMLDFELANMYGVETAQLKRQVRRNIERFEGEDFMFEVTHEEILRCQNGTSSWGGSSTALSELQSREPRCRERRPIGFVVPEEKAKNTPPSQQTKNQEVTYITCSTPFLNGVSAPIRHLMLIAA